MSANIDLVKKLNNACESKDFEKAKSLLHPEYTLKDPQMRLKGPQEFVEFMQNCPMDGSMKNASFIEAGDKVVQTLDCVMTKPTSFTFRMCDIVTIKDGKIFSEETFYDTGSFPKEVLEASKQAANTKSNKAA